MTVAVQGEAGAHWLNAARVTGYSRIFLAFYAAACVALALSCTNGIDYFDKPFGYDFITFWSAGHLALEGQAATAFDPETIFAAQQVAVPANTKLFLWHYPPTFHMMVTPLAALPYFAALAVWTILSLMAFAWIVRKVAPHPQAFWLALASGGAFVNLLHGQNAFFNVALFAGSMVMLLERRQIAAGVLMGLMIYKPHLGILVPLAFIAGRQWTAFAAAAATGAAFTAVATLTFGIGYWQAFFDNLAVARAVLESGDLSWGKMPTAFAAARILGADTALAYALQALSALAAAAAVLWLWRKGPTPAAAAGLIAAALLVSPYGFDYDLAMLSVAVAMLVWRNVQSGQWLAWEREIYLIVAVVPLAMQAIADTFLLQVGLLLPLAVLWVAIGHRRREIDLAQQGAAA